MISSTDLIRNADGSVYHLGLRAEHLADTLLLVGDPERVAQVSQHWENIEFRQHRREFVTHTGNY
ncbi:MAG: phosphorylase, partial [Bacteroidota bacterium]